LKGLGKLMEMLAGLFEFARSMHISAVVIISVIITIFLLSFILHIALRGKYRRLYKELLRQASAGRSALAPADGQGKAAVRDRFSEPRFRSRLLRETVTEFEAAYASKRGVEVNTQVIIENQFNVHMRGSLAMERFTRNSISVMIVLGLLGTFIGLTISVQSLVMLFRNYDVAELLSSVESGLLYALSGMSTAFTTSLFGIACSVVITFMNIFINPSQTRETLMSAIEEYLDTNVSARLMSAAGDGTEKMNDALKSTFIDFGERIADRFDRSLLTIREDVRGIEDVNNNLRNTIEQMDVSLVRIADALKASTRHVESNYGSLAELSKKLERSGEEYGNVSKESAQHAAEMVKSVNEAARAIASLTADLRGEAQRRLDNFATYNAAISQMAGSASLIRDAVAAIPEQMLAYSEASRIPDLSREKVPPETASIDDGVFESESAGESGWSKSK